MRRVRIVGPVLSVLLPLCWVIGAAAPATAVTAETVVTSHDQPRDVRLFGGDRLTPREKKSIDLGRVRVQRVGNRARVSIQFREVIRVPRFDQMFFVNLIERRDAPGGQWRTDVGFTTKDRYSYSGYSSMDGNRYVNCRPDVTVRPLKRQITVTVPGRCTAEGPVKIAVTSDTGTFRSNAPVYSRDTHTVAGRHTIHP